MAQSNPLLRLLRLLPLLLLAAPFLAVVSNAEDFLPEIPGQKLEPLEDPLLAPFVAISAETAEFPHFS
ncbi:hypothetical protein E4U41_004782, partial [Claviceps citrina]